MAARMVRRKAPSGRWCSHAFRAAFLAFFLGYASQNSSKPSDTPRPEAARAGARVCVPDSRFRVPESRDPESRDPESRIKNPDSDGLAVFLHGLQCFSTG